jgi:ABC-2 type transport system permease protein
MILEFIRLELQYRKKRPATWIYIGFVLLFSVFLGKYFNSGNTDIRSNGDLFSNIIISTFLFLPIVSAIMGVPNIRDNDYNLTSLLLSKPINRFNLFLGRFLGSFFFIFIIFFTYIFGTYFNFVLNHNTAPDAFWVKSLLIGFVVYALPNALFFSILFYGIASVIQKRGIIYSQGFIFLIGIQFLFTYSRNVPSKSIVRFFEPLGIYALRFDNMYVNTLDRQVWLPGFDDVTLLNRLFTIGISIIGFYVFYRFYKYEMPQSSIPQKKFLLQEIVPSAQTNPVILSYQTEFLFSNFIIFLKSTSFYFSIIIKEVFFRIVGVLGFIFMCFLLYNRFTASDRTPFPTTANIIPSISGTLMTILSVLSIYYAGDLIFKEKNVGFNPILDSSPIKKWLILASKLMGFMGAVTVLTCSMILFGVLFQVINGNTDIKWSAYFWEGFVMCILETFIWMCLFIFIQTIVASRSLGPIVAVAIYFAFGVGVNFGFENPLFSFNALNISGYNDWFGYGQYLEHYLWAKIYWLALGIVLFTMSIPLQLNEAAKNKWERFINFNRRLSTGMKATIAASLAIFVTVGYFIYFKVEYNGEGFQSYVEKRKLLADYERNFEKYKTIPQPKITKVFLAINLPKNRELTGKATYILTNKTTKPIQKLYIQEPFGDKAYFIKNISTNIGFKDSIDAHYGFHVLTLAKAMQPKDTLILTHEMAYFPQHFSYMSGQNMADIVENGSTFVANQHLISFGFNDSFVIEDNEDRQTENLEKFRKEAKISDLFFSQQNTTNTNADAIDLDLKISTEGNQAVVGLENCISKSSKDNKNTFHFTSKNIPYEFAFAVGDFKKTVEEINGIQVEYDIHPNHPEQLAIIQKATKDAILFMNERIGAFPFKSLVIAEAAPKSNEEFDVFPGMILLREKMMVSSGFDPDLKFDRTYETIVTAISEQWFSKKMAASKVQGNQILQTSINRFMASLIMAKNQSEEAKNDYIKQEHQRYRTAYRQLKDNEFKIDAIVDPKLVESRGSVILNSLAGTIGQVQVLDAIKKLYEEFVNTEKYPNYRDFMRILEQQVGADKKHYISEAFDSQIFYDHRLVDEIKTIKNKDNYTFILSFEARKYEIDNKNTEQNKPHNEPIEIGLLDKNDKILKIIEINLVLPKNKAYITFKEKPYKFIIDPRYKYFDLVRQDNMMKL